MNIVVYTALTCYKILQITHNGLSGLSLAQDLVCDPVNPTDVLQSVYRHEINTYQ
jgi:hypothetical protein